MFACQILSTIIIFYILNLMPRIQTLDSLKNFYNNKICQNIYLCELI
jgi:hypothetical protein